MADDAITVNVVAPSIGDHANALRRRMTNLHLRQLQPMPYSEIFAKDAFEPASDDALAILLGRQPFITERVSAGVVRAQSDSSDFQDVPFVAVTENQRIGLTASLPATMGGLITFDDQSVDITFEPPIEIVFDGQPTIGGVDVPPRGTLLGFRATDTYLSYTVRDVDGGPLYIIHVATGRGAAGSAAFARTLNVTALDATCCQPATGPVHHRVGDSVTLYNNGNLTQGAFYTDDGDITVVHGGYANPGAYGSYTINETKLTGPGGIYHLGTGNAKIRPGRYDHTLVGIVVGDAYATSTVWYNGP